MMKNLFLAAVAGVALMFTAGTSTAQAGGVYVGPGGVHIRGNSGFRLDIGGGVGFGYGYPYGSPYYRPHNPYYRPYPPVYRPYPPVYRPYYPPVYRPYPHHRGW